MNHCMGEHKIAIEGYYFETDRLKDVYIFSIATMQQVDTLKNLKALSQDDFKALCRRWVLQGILNDEKAV
jgi:hypothetical protein